MRPWHDPAWRAECARGARDLMPAVPGTFAWGLVTGVAMVKSGLTVPLALVMTLFVYAGSAQLASLPLIASAAPVWVITATAFATNMRFVIYAAAMRQHLAMYGKRRLAVLGYLSGDFPFVYFMNRIARDGAFAHRDAWKFGLAATNWVVWQVSSIVGIVGAWLGGVLAGMLGFAAVTTLSSIIVAIAGACVLIALLKALNVFK